MICSKCGRENDPDARFCTGCGGDTGQEPETTAPVKSGRRPYLYMLLLVPVLLIAVGIGYYKFFLPAGIAAVVNGEEIKVSELDTAVIKTTGSREATDSRLRYQILNALITERLLLQEARKAGLKISDEELLSAAKSAQIASGLEPAMFDQQVGTQYGSKQEYEKMLLRGLLVNKFVSEKIIPANAGPRESRAALEQWLQNHSGSASVRVTLAEQWSGAGCGCCGNKTEASVSPRGGSGGCRMSRNASAGLVATAQASPVTTDAVAKAGVRYWQDKYGPDEVSAKVTDYGCHMQVEIIKDNKVIGSLRYQAGSLTEE